MRTKSDKPLLQGRAGAPAPARFRDGAYPSPVPFPARLDRVVRDLFPGASWNEARHVIHRGKVRVAGRVKTDAGAHVAPGTLIEIQLSARRPETSGLSEDRLVYSDAHVVVVDKPAGIATVPFEDERDTLDRLVLGLLRKAARGKPAAPLGVVQRLDKETSGLIVFARTLAAKRGLQQQFRMHSVHRRYVAVAHGDVATTTIRSRLVQNRGDGLRGSTSRADLGRDAVTHVRVLEALPRATLIECRLETGRTHQIRIHLAESGHPLVGERVYVRELTSAPLPAPRLLLHAAELGFSHPNTGAPLSFRLAPPDDFERALAALRA